MKISSIHTENATAFRPADYCRLKSIERSNFSNVPRIAGSTHELYTWSIANAYKRAPIHIGDSSRVLHDTQDGCKTINDILCSAANKSLATVNGLGLLISHLAYLREMPLPEKL